MNDEMLEILMGKYLDGEIRADEQQMLEDALEQDTEARELFEQLQGLHQSSRDAVQTDVLAAGRSFDDVIESAWRRRRPRILRVIASPGTLRFVAGLAAGILIGVGIHLYSAGGAADTSQNGRTPVVAQKTDDQGAEADSGTGSLRPERSPAVTRNVDWYTFTDESGTTYVVEGYRENMVKPAVYGGRI